MLAGLSTHRSAEMTLPRQHTRASRPSGHECYDHASAVWAAVSYMKSGDPGRRRGHPAAPSHPRNPPSRSFPSWTGPSSSTNSTCWRAPGSARSSSPSPISQRRSSQSSETATLSASRSTMPLKRSPLGTGGAVKNAEPYLDSTTLVFNGDILTDVDLPAVVADHRLVGRAGHAGPHAGSRTPPPSVWWRPTPRGRVLRFTEKPEPSQITTDTINAGIYVLETSTLSLSAREVHSIERSFFPALLARGDLVRAHVHGATGSTSARRRSTCRSIGTYSRAASRSPSRPTADRGGWLHRRAPASRPGADLRPPFYLGPDCRVRAGAFVGPDATCLRRSRGGRASGTGRRGVSRLASSGRTPSWDPTPRCAGSGARLAREDRAERPRRARRPCDRRVAP